MTVEPSTHKNYKILLDDNCDVLISEDILLKIPMLNQLMENIKNDDKILNKTLIDLQTENYPAVLHIIALLKYNASSSYDEHCAFNETFIKNMNDMELTNFILTTHHFGLTHFEQLASTRFLSVLRNNNIDDIRTELKIKNNFSPNEMENISVHNEWKTE